MGLFLRELLPRYLRRRRLPGRLELPLLGLGPIRRDYFEAHVSNHRRIGRRIERHGCVHVSIGGTGSVKRHDHAGLRNLVAPSTHQRARLQFDTADGPTRNAQRAGASHGPSVVPSRLSVAGDDEHRARGVVDHVGAHRAQEDSFKSSEPPGPHNDGVDA